jgi:hypothetical protein
MTRHRIDPAVIVIIWVAVNLVAAAVALVLVLTK